MIKSLDAVFIIFTVVKIRAREPELPLCPTNMSYFPQNLPMHCRMPSGGVYESGPDTQKAMTMPPFPAEFYQSPPPDKLPGPIPFPIPPGMPGFPGLPPGLPPGFPPGMPGPGPMPMPMPMPMPLPGPAHKLPVIVMPFYSPDPSYKGPKRQVNIHPRDPRGFSGSDSDMNRIVPHHRRPRLEIHTKRPHRKRHRYYSSTDTSGDTSSDTSSDTSTDTTSSEDRGWWNPYPQRGERKSGRRMNSRRQKSKRRRHGGHNLLTPILQYVTKDGYVIFEKKISKGEAKDWLSIKNEEAETTLTPEVAKVEDENKNEDFEPNELDAEVEILNSQKESQTKPPVEVQTHRPRRPHPHKLKKSRRVKPEREGTTPS